MCGVPVPFILIIEKLFPNTFVQIAYETMQHFVRTKYQITVLYKKTRLIYFFKNKLIC